MRRRGLPRDQEERIGRTISVKFQILPRRSYRSPQNPAISSELANFGSSSRYHEAPICDLEGDLEVPNGWFRLKLFGFA